MITAVAEQASEVVRPVAPYLVSVEITPGQPILSITAIGTDETTVIALGKAAVETLPTVAREAPGGGDSVRVETVGAQTIAIKTSGGRKTIALAALVFFAFWCIAVIALDRPLRRRRSRLRLRAATGGAA